MKKSTEQKILQVANLSPSESWIESIVETHPMKQIFVMSIVQVVVFGLMLASFGVINLYLEGRIT